MKSLTAVNRFVLVALLVAGSLAPIGCTSPRHRAEALHAAPADVLIPSSRAGESDLPTLRRLAHADDRRLLSDGMTMDPDPTDLSSEPSGEERVASA